VKPECRLWNSDGVCADVTIWNKTRPELKVILAGERTMNRFGNFKSLILYTSTLFQKTVMNFKIILIYTINIDYITNFRYWATDVV
jgi:hypothetical protein